MNKDIVLAVVAIVLSLFLVGCGERRQAEAEKEYSLLHVAKSDVCYTDKYPSTIKGQQDVEIYPQVSGRITKVYVTEGQSVRRGQTLFIIDQTPYRAALQAARANLSAARAQVATARLSYQGKAELYENRVSSLFDKQKAYNALLTAQAALQQAVAQVTEARNNLSYTTVASPCDGVVGTLPYRIGALVGPTLSQPLTTISDNRQMYVYFSVSESQVIEWVRRYGSTDKAVASMPSVSLFLSDGSRYDKRGRVESISGVFDGETGSLLLRAVFPNPQGLLHSGGAGNVGVEVEKRGVIAIPQSATYELQDKVFVYRLLNGKAVATRIEAIALNDQKLYVVMKGLAVGDILVADGVSMLKDGQAIKVKKSNKE